MAIRYAIASGNWSNPAIWDGGVAIPTSADDVYANNFTVTINQDITAVTLRNTSNAAPVIASGGFFLVTGSSGTRNITLTGTRQSVSFENSGLWMLNTTAKVLDISSTSGMTVNLTSPAGNCNTNICFALHINGNCTVNYAGIINPNSGFFTQFIVNSTSSNGTLNIVGNVIGMPSGTQSVWLQAANYTLNVIGNVTGGGAAGILMQAATILNVTGNVIGSSNAGITFNGGNGTVVTVTGNITAGTAAGLTSNSSNATFVINGNVTASSANNGVIGNTIGTLVTVNGNLTNVANVNAVYAFKLRISPTAQQTWTYQTAGSNRQMFTANAFSGGTMPVASDVRLGVSYAGGALTGTCVVPSANSVVWGVPVDNTVGNAVITRAQLFSDTGAIIAAYPQIN